nr:hypothetical protein [Kibdelosporangium sp. MJ126-NF4]CTQ91391.1 hypothetical protein [Kibdelosporangium sp. MJ126-NF4]
MRMILTGWGQRPLDVATLERFCEPAPEARGTDRKGTVW